MKIMPRHIEVKLIAFIEEGKNKAAKKLYTDWVAGKIS